MNIKFKQYESERFYPIGFKFTRTRPNGNIRKMKIIDYAITHNIKGEVIEFKYIVAYEFLAQDMETTVCQTTIDIATNNGWKELKS